MDHVARRAGPEDAAAIDGSALLKVLVPRLWKQDKDLRASLRACSRETLRLSNSCVEFLRWFQLRNPVVSPAQREAAAAQLRSVLASGCRPRRLGLHLNGPRPAASTAFGLRVLAELRAMSPAPQLTTLHLTALPLTVAVVRAIAAVAPCLSELSLASYDLSYCTGLPSSLPFRPSLLSGVQGLLRLAAPHLQQLSLEQLAAPASDPLGAGALAGLASLVLQCSRLEVLNLRLRDAAPAPNSSFAVLLSALAQLSALRSLNMDLPLAHDAGSCVPLPTGLTRLVFSGTCDVDAVVPTLACMRSLAELLLFSCKLRPLHLQQMTGLTALTQLAVKGIWTTDEASHNGASAPGGLAEHIQPLMLLPAQLQSLHFAEPARPSEVVALQLPTALLRVCVAGLKLHADDKDAQGCLCPPAAEVLLAACRQLVGRLSHADYADDPFELDLCGAAAPASWPDGYGTLFAAMQPLALRGLTVQNVTLTLYDMDALVRHLPLLEELRLDCAVELPSLPLLCRLKQLVILDLSPEEGGVVEGWDSGLALRTALLVVCVEAPSLKSVFLMVDQEHAVLFEASVMAVGWLAEELPALRADPPGLEVI